MLVHKWGTDTTEYYIYINYGDRYVWRISVSEMAQCMHESAIDDYYDSTAGEFVVAYLLLLLLLLIIII